MEMILIEFGKMKICKIRVKLCFYVARWRHQIAKIEYGEVRNFSSTEAIQSPFSSFLFLSPPFFSTPACPFLSPFQFHPPSPFNSLSFPPLQSTLLSSSFISSCLLQFIFFIPSSVHLSLLSLTSPFFPCPSLFHSLTIFRYRSNWGVAVHFPVLKVD